MNTESRLVPLGSESISLVEIIQSISFLFFRSEFGSAEHLFSLSKVVMVWVNSIDILFPLSEANIGEISDSLLERGLSYKIYKMELDR